MIGNDIVDLQLAAEESNWCRKGYLTKIFSPEEQAMIFAAADPDEMVWRMWSAKEAVYKIVHRQTLVRAYAPLQFTYFNNHFVMHNGNAYPFISYRNEDCIHTIAVMPGHRAILHNCAYEKDENGLPYILENGLRVAVSVSHHGRYRGLVKAIPV